jgi:hypothetical protein
VLAGHAGGGLGVDEQRGAASLAGPSARLLVVGVVDPGQGSVGAGVGVDRRQLPVRPPAGRGLVEGQVGQGPGEAEGVEKVLVGPLLPAAAPRELERLPEVEQVRARGGRKEMTDAVDEHEAPRWTLVGSEAVERDDAVDVDEEQGLSWHVVGKVVTIKTRHANGGAGTLLATVQVLKRRMQGPDYQFQSSLSRTRFGSTQRSAASLHP